MMAMNFFSELWIITLDAAPFLCLGLFLGALLHRYVKTEWVTPLLGRGKIRSTMIAAAIGTPLPLCSCSVVPTALAIQKKGASRGATLAFLISTPETGVDSILLTYGLLGPVLAVARPVAALLSAIMAGLMLESFPDDPAESEPDKESCCSGDSAHTAPPAVPQPLIVRVFEECRGIWQSLMMLFDEIAMWLLIGLSLSALISVILPSDFFEGGLGTGLTGMLVAMSIGLPMYVCATASTPLALAFMAKGMSAGAALVFLLTGPATNVGTMGIVLRVLGKKGMFAYLSAIIFVSLIFGVMVDAAGLAPGVGGHSLDSHAHGGELAAKIAGPLIWALLAWRIGRKVYAPHEEAVHAASA